MTQIGTIQGYTISWSDPAYDGGRGTGQVMVGPDNAGNATSKDAALEVAKEHIRVYHAKLGR